MSGSLSGFNIGIGGLRTSAGAIDVVSTNISNTNTVGYKGADYLFVDQYFRALSSTEVGRAAQGVSNSSVIRQFAQGALRTTSSPLDLAINGQGFFRLSSKTGTDAGLIYYTRNGQLSVDKDGYLVNATGLYLNGFQPNSRADGVTDDIGPLKLPDAQKAPLATAASTLNVNLDARSDVKKNAGEATPKPFDPADDTTYASSTSFSIFDATGNKSTVKVYYRRVLDGSDTFRDESGVSQTRSVENYKLYMSVTNVDGNTSWIKDTDTDSTKEVFETVSDVPAGTLANDSDTNDFSVKTLSFFGGKNTDSIYRDRKSGESVDKTTVAFSIVTGVAGNLNKQPITITLTDTSRYSEDFEVKDLVQDGRPVGALNSVSFDESGILYGVYSNGERLVAGQAVLARFKSEGGLSPVAQTLFAETVSSGDALLGVAGSGALGVVRSTSLEEANIDMASELVKLMIQQRNYQANSESIRAQDELLKSTISLAR